MTSSKRQPGIHIKREGSSGSKSAVWIVLMLLALAVLFTGHAVAQTESEPGQGTEKSAEGLKMEVRQCFDGFIRQGCYFPIRVTLENSGPSRKGQLRVVSQESTNPLTATFLAECDIPTNSRKTYFLYPYFLEADPSPSIFVQYVETTPVATEVIDLKSLLDEERLWVEVADEGADFVFLSGVSLPEGPSFADIARFAAAAQGPSHGSYRSPYTGGSPPPNTRYSPADPLMVWVKPSGLPDRPEGYESVEGLILNTRRFYELTEEQKAALAEWIVSGGRVIMWLGEDPNRYQGSFLTGAIDGSGWAGPSAITEPTVRTTLGELRTVPGLTGHNPFRGDFPVTFAPQASARTLFAEGDIPVLQHLKLGDGDILLSGLNLGAMKATTSAGLGDYLTFMMGYLMAADDRMEPIVKTESPYRYGWGRGGQNPNPFVEQSRYRLSYDIDNLLQSDNLTALPAVKSVALFLVAYIIVVGPVNYFILLRMRRREWLWYTIPLVVAAFVIASYSWALSTKGARLMLARVNVLDAFPSAQTAWESSWFSLFSPAARRYDVELGTGRDLIRRLETPSVQSPMYGVTSQEYSPADMLNLMQHGKRGEAFVSDAYIKIWSELHLESSGACESPGSAFLENVSLDGYHLVGKLNVALNYDLQEPFLYYYTQGQFVGKRLQAGSEAGLRNGSIDFDLLTDSRADSISLGTMGSQVSSRSRKLRDAALEVLNTRPTHNSGDDELVLAGWRSSVGDRALASPRIRATSEETLVLIHIPLVIEKGNSPVEGAEGQIVALSAANMEIEPSGALLLTDGQMVYSISLPPTGPSVELPGMLRVSVGTTDTSAPFTVWVFSREQGVWVRMPEFGSTRGRVMIRLNDVGRYFAPDGRTLFLRIEGDSAVAGDIIALNGITINAS